MSFTSHGYFIPGSGRPLMMPEPTVKCGGIHSCGVCTTEAQKHYNMLEEGQEAEVVQLMNGRDVPKVCVDALDEYEKIWPGATFVNARPGIVAAVLDAIGYFDRDNAELAIREWAKRAFITEDAVFKVVVVASGETGSLRRTYFKVHCEGDSLSETIIFEARYDKATGVTSYSAYQDTGSEL